MAKEQDKKTDNKKPGNYKSMLDKFDAALNAYIHGVCDDITIEQIKTNFEELKSQESEYSKIDNLRGKYRAIMNKAETTIAVAENYGAQPAGDDEFTVNAEEIANSFVEKIQPFTDEFKAFTKQMKSVVSESKLTPRQKAKRKAGPGKITRREAICLGIGAAAGIGGLSILSKIYNAFTEPDGITPGKYHVNAVTYDGGENPLCGNPNPGWIKLSVKGGNIAIPCKGLSPEQARQAATRISNAGAIEVLAEPTDTYKDRSNKSWSVLPMTRLEIDRMEDL